MVIASLASGFWFWRATFLFLTSYRLNPLASITTDARAAALLRIGVLRTVIQPANSKLRTEPFSILPRLSAASPTRPNILPRFFLLCSSMEDHPCLLWQRRLKPLAAPHFFYIMLPLIIKTTYSRPGCQDKSEPLEKTHYLSVLLKPFENIDKM